MRTLKFRLVDKGRIISTQELKPGGIIDCPVDWDTAYQFTGLHDKYGHEIYEGDICKGVMPDSERDEPFENMVVEYNGAAFALFRTGRNKELYFGDLESPVLNKRIEVIGKSYEKKED